MDPRAGYVVLDLSSDLVQVSVARVPYDVARAARAVRDSTLPADFASYLERGGAAP
jgi:hypothetical protein